MKGTVERMRGRGKNRGFTVIEVTVAAAIIAAVVIVAFATFRQWTRDQHSSEMARAFAELLMKSRAEALAQGETTVVYFGQDRHGQPLTGAEGANVPALAIRDLNGNGEIDPDEYLGEVAYAPAGALSWGHSDATRRARGDPRGERAAPPAAAITFEKPDGALASWVAFRPDGNPRAYLDSTLAGTGAVGTGGGAVYLTSGGTDYAVVLSALGKVYIREWDDGSESWSR